MTLFPKIKYLTRAIENQPFELLGQSFPSRTVTLFWSHFDCSGAFWGPLETAFSWLEPLPPLAAGTEDRYGQRVQSRMSCPLLSYMALHGGSWHGSARLIWQFSPVCKAESRLQPEGFFLGGRWQSLCCEVVADANRQSCTCTCVQVNNVEV